MKTFSKINPKILYRTCLFAIFSLALFLRAFRLTEIPDVLHCDEAALGYNAWCLAHYGVDRYCNIMPVYPQNFYGGQSPLATYCTVLLLKAFGQDKIPLYLIRLPGLISSMIVVIFGTKSVSRIFHSPKFTILSALLLAVCPYYIMHGRFALDCNLMLGCSIVALYHLIKYIQSGRLSQLIVCGISFGIVLYTYALSYFVLAMFLCSIALYLLYTGKITIPRTIVWAVVVCVTALPILIFIFCLLFRLPPQHFLGFTIAPTASTRMNDLEAASWGERVWRYFRLTLTYSTYPLDAVDKFFTMYPISIPFIVIGIFISIYQFIVSVIKRTFHFSTVYLLFYLCGMITIGFVGGYYIYRTNYLFASYFYFLITGIFGVYHFLRKYRKAFLGGIYACYLLWSLSFTRYYFTIYSIPDIMHIAESLYFEFAGEPVSFVETELQPSEIYCDCKGESVYYFFYKPVSPYRLSETGNPDDSSWENYHFTIDGNTPPHSSGAAYIVRKENQEFLDQLYQSGLEYDTWDYDSYYVIYFR